MKKGLTVTVPEGAWCGLYPGAPETVVYATAIDPANAIPATGVTTKEGTAEYFYADLEPGLYHCAVSMEGYYSLCQMVHFTAEKAGTQLELKLEKRGGKGYEVGYTMLCTPEFNESQLVSHPDAWGERYARIFQTPQFLREERVAGRHMQTTNEEMMDFLAKLDAECDQMHVFSLGKTPKYGFDMPLVLFTRENVEGMTLEQAAQIIRKNGKPTIQYAAQCHSSEPASTEGALAMIGELCGEYGDRVLDKVDVYIVPRINLDGAVKAIRKSPTTGDDMNRDYLRLNNQEISMLISAYDLFLPEVAIDGHEKKSSIRRAGEDLCTDMELQVGAGSLNHPGEMTDLAMTIALEALGRGRSLGLRGHFYTKLASAAGGAAGSSYFGTRNSLSFLVETPGQVHLGMFYMERRVLAHYVFASSVIDYVAEHSRQILDTVHGSRETMGKTGPIYDENDFIVLEHDKAESGVWATPMIHVTTGEVTDPDYACPYFEQTIALKKRVRATAYLLPQGLEREEEILRVAAIHGIDHYRLPAGSGVSLRQYTCGEEVGLEDEKYHVFVRGAIVFPNTVPSTVLGVIMEPDFNASSGRKMTLLSMELIEPDENGLLPLFRYCHDLHDGKVLAE